MKKKRFLSTLLALILTVSCLAVPTQAFAEEPAPETLQLSEEAAAPEETGTEETPALPGTDALPEEETVPEEVTAPETEAVLEEEPSEAPEETAAPETPAETEETTGRPAEEPEETAVPEKTAEPEEPTAPEETAETASETEEATEPAPEETLPAPEAASEQKPVAAEGDFYVIFDEAAHVMTFTTTQPTDPAVRYFTGDADRVYTSDNDKPEWAGHTVWTVVFAKDFKTVQPVSLAYWFSRTRTLKTIEGMENLDLSRVKSTAYMFSRCENLTAVDFSPCIGKAPLTAAAYMFYDCTSLQSVNLTNLNTENVTNMSWMFYQCRKLKTITFGPDFKTERLSNMYVMFTECYQLRELDLSGMNLSRVSNAEYMLRDCRMLERLVLPESFHPLKNLTFPQTRLTGYHWAKLDGSGEVVERYTEEKTQIPGPGTYVPDLEGLSLIYWAVDASKNLTISSSPLTGEKTGFFSAEAWNYVQPEWGTDIVSAAVLDPIRPQSMNYWFSRCQSLTRVDLSKTDTSELKECYTLFSDCTALEELDLSFLNTKGAQAYGILSGDTALKKVTFGEGYGAENGLLIEVPDYDRENETEFLCWQNAETGELLTAGRDCFPAGKGVYKRVPVPEEGIAWWKLSTEGTDAGLMTLSSKPFEGAEPFSLMIVYSGQLPWEDLRDEIREIRVIKAADGSGFKVRWLDYWFWGAENLVSADLTGFDTSACESMAGLLSGCPALQSVDLTGLDTSACLSFDSLFAGCAALEKVDVSGLDTSACYSLSDMFSGCSSLSSVDISGFDLSKVGSYSYMFYNCSSLEEIDFSGLSFCPDGASVSYMFLNCSKLKVIDLRDLVVGHNETTSTFYGCTGLEQLILGPGWVNDVFFDENSYFPLKMVRIDDGSYDVYEQYAFMPNYMESEAGLNIYCTEALLDLSRAEILPVPAQTYTGTAITPAPAVLLGAAGLQEGLNYTVSYENNTNAGTAAVTVTGTGALTGTISRTFTIRPAKLSAATVTAPKAQTYSGKALTPAPTAKFGGKTLKSGTDYTVTYKNNTKAGTATVTLKGKGNFTGSVSRTFAIKPASLKAAKITGLADKTYTGKAVTQSPVVKFGGKTLKAGTDYTVSYKNNTNAGTATVTLKGKGNFTGSVSRAFAVKPASLAAAKITGLSDTLYTGKAITPAPVVKLGTKTLKAGTDYTVSYANNKEVGTAAVTVTGKGNYTGSVKAAFKIQDPVEEFVARLYRVCLDREPEAQGHAWWVARLRSKQETGGSCAWGFFDSTEFKNHHYSNSAFLDHAYAAFFDRRPDAAGKAYWLDEMKKGMTREQVITKGFAVSNEWKALCQYYDITP